MASISGWTEGIMLSLLFVVCLGIVVAGLNEMYGQSYEIGLDTGIAKSDMVQYQQTMAEQIQGGEAEFTTSQGLTLKSSWAIVKAVVTVIWNFLTGGWIETAVSYMRLPTEVGVIFRLLYVFSVGFALLRMLFKVKP